MRIAGYISDSLINGRGVNLVVFFQGCHIKCPGCQNPELQDERGGVEVSAEEVFAQLTPVTTGIVISGGEPTEQIESALALAVQARSLGLQTTLYTGLDLEALRSKPFFLRVITIFDFVKVGPYVEALRTTVSGPFGSSNQQLLDTREIVRKEYEECKEDLEKILTSFRSQGQGEQGRVLSQRNSINFTQAYA